MKTRFAFVSSVFSACQKEKKNMQKQQRKVGVTGTHPQRKPTDNACSSRQHNNPHENYLDSLDDHVHVRIVCTVRPPGLATGNDEPTLKLRYCRLHATQVMNVGVFEDNNDQHVEHGLVV